jgi:hypothetical protein
MGNLFPVQVLLDSRVRRRPNRAKDEENLVALDKTPRLLERLRRTVSIVIADEIDLASVDAALIVTILKNAASNFPTAP